MSTLAGIDLGLGILAVGMYLSAITNVWRKATPFLAVLALLFSICGLAPAFISGSQISYAWVYAVVFFACLVGLSLGLLDQKDIKASLGAAYRAKRWPSFKA